MNIKNAAVGEKSWEFYSFAFQGKSKRKNKKKKEQVH